MPVDSLPGGAPDATERASGSGDELGGSEAAIGCVAARASLAGAGSERAVADGGGGVKLVRLVGVELQLHWPPSLRFFSSWPKSGTGWPGCC